VYFAVYLHVRTSRWTTSTSSITSWTKLYTTLTIRNTIILNNIYYMRQTRQCNNQVRSCKHFCRGKVINIKYSECVFVDLGIQHAMHMCHIVSCGLPGSTIFLRTILQTARFSKKVIRHKMWFDSHYKLFLKHSSFYEEMCDMWLKSMYWFSYKVSIFSRL
jgi:hypothetical protein